MSWSRRCRRPTTARPPGRGSGTTINRTEPRELDLVLVGATGFAGRLTAAHLEAYAPPGLRIGLAGRSEDRLARTRGDLGPAAPEWPLITVDVTDPGAAADLAARSAVILTTAGPYLRYGLPLVSACADAGTDYADLSGETIFVRRSIDAAHLRAAATGARIVHSCGFDSVPSDLGVGSNADRAEADGQGRLARTVLRVRSFRGGVSGGTIDSLRQQIIETRSDPELRALAANPRALTDDPSHRSGAGSGGRGGPGRGSGISRDPRTGRWQAPFVMGGYNRQVVLRSAELRGTDPEHQLRYSEVLDTGTGAAGAARAGLLAAGSTALMAGMWFEPTRRLLDRVLPAPGAGPSERSRARGRFLFEVVSETTTGARYLTRVGAEADPGYDATAIMLGEAGLALVGETAGGEGPDAGRRGPGGVLTPMAALGAPYAERLRRHGFTVATEQLG